MKTFLIVVNCSALVNAGIPRTHYLDKEFQLCLPGLDWLREFVITNGRGCYVYKKICNGLIGNFQLTQKITSISVSSGTTICTLILGVHSA